MNHRKCWCVVALGVMALVWGGCMPKMTIEQMKEARPQRPAELDKLNMFVGEWESTSEMNFKMLEEPMRGSGKSSISWGCDGWCLVEHNEFEMGELGKMFGVGVWTWDAKSKKYRVSWFDSYGSTGHGKATYSEADQAWTMKTRSRNPWGTSVGRGTVTFSDKDTMEWTWKEWDSLKLFQTMEMTGTNKRK